MKATFITKFIVFLLLCSSMISCTEPYQMKTNTFEDALVVEATITNELKKQQIKVSRTYRFEENGPTFESGAIVYITDDTGNQYDFSEQNGIYESNQEFQAIPGKEYQLFIVTDDGKEYTSTVQKLTTINEIQNVISKYGCVVDFHLFSDIAISMTIEIDEFKIDILHDELTKIIGIQKFEYLNSNSKEERIVYLNITFAKGTGNLKIEVPSVPG